MNETEHDHDAAPLRAVPEEPIDLDWTMPVDFAILAELPAQGSRLGYHPRAATVKAVIGKLNDGVPAEARMTSALVSRRMVELHRFGLVVHVKVHGAGGAKGYQITTRGKAALDAGRKEGLA